MNKNGFSLVEIMVGLTMLGGVSLGVLKLSENQRKAFEYQTSKSVEIDIYNQVRYILASKDACKNTFENFNITNSVQIPVIKNDTGGNFITNTQQFGNSAKVNNFELIPSGLSTDPVERISTSILRVSIDRMKGIKNTFTKDIIVTVKTDSNNTISECVTEEDSVFDIAKKDMCESVGGTFIKGPPTLCNLNCPVTTPSSDITELTPSGNLLSAACLDTFKNDILDNRYALKLDNDGDGTADTMTGTLNIGGTTIVEGEISTSQGIRVAGNTHNFAPHDCGTGSIVTGFDSSGAPICSNISCPPNSYFRGLNASGTKNCISYNISQSCPNPEQYVQTVNPDGSIVCANKPIPPVVTCGPERYLKGINSNGLAICDADIGVESFTCGTNEALVKLSSGTYQCLPFTDTNVFGTSCSQSDHAISGFSSTGAPNCDPIPCTPNWKPSRSIACPGINVHQADGCGNTRTRDGTSLSSTCGGGSSIGGTGSGTGGTNGTGSGGTWSRSDEDASCAALGIGPCGSPTPINGNPCPTVGIICAQTCSNPNEDRPVFTCL